MKRAAEERRAADMRAADGVAVLVRALDQGVVTGDVDLWATALSSPASMRTLNATTRTSNASPSFQLPK